MSCPDHRVASQEKLTYSQFRRMLDVFILLHHGDPEARSLVQVLSARLLYCNFHTSQAFRRYVFDKARKLGKDARNDLCRRYGEMLRARTRRRYEQARDKLLQHINTSESISQKCREPLRDYILQQIDSSPFHECFFEYSRRYFRYDTGTNNMVESFFRCAPGVVIAAFRLVPA